MVLMMKKIFNLFVLLMVFTLVSCAAAPDGYYRDMSNQDDQMGQEVEMEPGQITVCAYNDNTRYEYWQSLLNTTQEGPAIFHEYANRYAFNTQKRLKLVFPANSYVEVSLMKENAEISTSIADKNGVCYLYPNFDAVNYDIKIKYLNQNNEMVENIETVNGDTSFIIDAMEYEINKIELLFMIDTTGSMSDEINYIKAEVKDVIRRVKAANDNVEIKVGILLYRDYGDFYITKSFAFNDDIEEVQRFINNAKAAGGGDFEEAVQVAFDEANSIQWSQNATKLLIHIADAPAHDEDVRSWNNSINDLASKGVRIISVASSGIDKKTEYFFRSQSIITNGYYLYITDESGVGEEHLEGSVEERPVVEYLNDALVRLINGYHSGHFADPIPYGQINQQ